MKRVFSFSLAAIIIAVALTTVHSGPLDEWWKDNVVKPVESVGGRCGVAGEGRIFVVNETRQPKHVLLERESDSNYEQELQPGKSFDSAICNQKGVRVKIFSSSRCGKTALGESRFVRVYNRETIRIRPNAFKYDAADHLQVAGTVSGFVLTSLAEGYGIPPQVLEQLGVKEAGLVSACSKPSSPTEAAQCLYKIYDYLPQDLKTTVKEDKCLSKAMESGGQNDNSKNTQFGARYFRLINGTNETLKVHLRYRGKLKDGKFDWIPSSADKWLTYTIEPGQKTYLSHNGARIEASKVALWAESQKSSAKWLKFKDGFWIVEKDGSGDRRYSAASMQTHDHRITSNVKVAIPEGGPPPNHPGQKPRPR